MKIFNLKLILVMTLAFLSVQSLDAYTSKKVFEKYPNNFFVESGSCVGDGIQMAIDSGFKKIYSIELKESYYENCCRRFAFYPFVKLFLGDTTDTLPSVLKEINAPATFWLDGHYSGSDTAKGRSNTPLLAELDHIAQHPIKTHTILIDDIRQFGTSDMDFVTLEEVKEKIYSINPDYEFRFEDGYVRGDVLVAVIPSHQQPSAETPAGEFFLANTLMQDSSFKKFKVDVTVQSKKGWCSEEKANLIMDLIHSEQPQICVEIGAFTGSSVLPIAATLKYLNCGMVYAVDAWSNEQATVNMDDADPNKAWWSNVDMNSIKKSFEQMLEKWELQSYCKVIQSSSELAANEFESIDFLHLDGDYTEEGSVKDVMLYLPKVRQNGYILVSNLHMLINNKYLKQKSFALLFDECEVICRIEKGNAVLLRKL